MVVRFDRKKKIVVWKALRLAILERKSYLASFAEQDSDDDEGAEQIEEMRTELADFEKLFSDLGAELRQK